jgi:hypothetical protein
MFQYLLHRKCISTIIEVIVIKLTITCKITYSCLMRCLIVHNEQEYNQCRLLRDELYLKYKLKILKKMAGKPVAEQCSSGTDTNQMRLAEQWPTSGSVGDERQHRASSNTFVAYHVTRCPLPCGAGCNRG